ncbi:MAG: hypothetical protein JO069_16185 [Verrucomicrobia bacterium]|nr:hypothetical protein [Verrucomicrobiota bacterium]
MSKLSLMDSNHDKVIQSHFSGCSVLFGKELFCAGQPILKQDLTSEIIGTRRRRTDYEQTNKVAKG